MLEALLFGHQKGSFTGAVADAAGKFEAANGGTLFLDEIGDMPFDLQTRLLRVLSDGNFYRVGGHSAVKAHVRVIAATHQNLEQRVKEGGFREDLFHRLNVIRLRLPALRERREDVPMLTRYFLQQSATQLGVEPKRISDAALAWLGQFAFGGHFEVAGLLDSGEDAGGAGADGFERLDGEAGGADSVGMAGGTTFLEQRPHFGLEVIGIHPHRQIQIEADRCGIAQPDLLPGHAVAVDVSVDNGAEARMQMPVYRGQLFIPVEIIYRLLQGGQFFRRDHGIDGLVQLTVFTEHSHYFDG